MKPGGHARTTIDLWRRLQTRDFVHVQDVVQATLLATGVELQRCGEIFYVGTGEGVTIEEIAARISNHREHLDARPGKQLHSWVDIGKIQEQLGWHP